MRLTEVPDLLDASIRVRLDRERILALDPEVTLSAGPAGALAAVIVPPWFFAGTRLVDFDARDGVSHSFAWVAAHSDIDGAGSDAPPHGPVAPPLAVPCYRIDERVLCLDGNHRLLALVRHRPEAVVVTITIEGPRDPAILPDLAHWR